MDKSKYLWAAMAVCSVLGAGLPNLTNSFPPSSAPYLHGAGAIFALLTGVLGAISKSMTEKKDGDA